MEFYGIMIKDNSIANDTCIYWKKSATNEKFYDMLTEMMDHWLSTNKVVALGEQSYSEIEEDRQVLRGCEFIIHNYDVSEDTFKETENLYYSHGKNPFIITDLQEFIKNRRSYE